MIYNSTDSEYYRRAARVFHTLRYVTLLLLICLVILGFTAYKRELTLENFRYIVRYADFDIGTDFHTLNQISYNVSENSDISYIKGDIAVLSDTEFKTYDFTGANLLSQRISYFNPKMEISDSYALCFDVSGTGLSIYNSYSCIYSDTFEYGIRDADIKSSGAFAVATSGKYLSSKIIYYAENLKEKFTYETRDKEVIALSLPDKTDKLDFLTLQAKNGSFYLLLHSYELDSDEPVFVKEFYDEFPISLYSDKDNICILTDKAIHFFDRDGNQVANYSYNGETLKGFFESEDYIAVTYAKNILENSTISVYTKQGDLLFEENFDSSVNSFSSFGNRVYILEKGLLNIIDVITENGTAAIEKNTIEVDLLYTDVFAKSGNEYILASSKGAGKFN